MAVVLSLSEPRLPRFPARHVLSRTRATPALHQGGKVIKACTFAFEGVPHDHFDVVLMKKTAAGHGPTA